MRESNVLTENSKSKIQCVEVLISRNALVNSRHNLHWTLSVYSLENQPVTRSRFLHNSEIFHFMVYDWKRTIAKLLDEHQVPYSIIQYFSPETIHSDASVAGSPMSDYESRVLAALKQLAVFENTDRSMAAMVEPSSADEANADLMVEKSR